MALNFFYQIGGTGTDPTQEEIDNNILCIYGAMHSYGFSDVAIAGMCGCFYEESHMNPGIYESSHGGNLSNLPYFPGGMGLGQWTDYPPYESKYPNPLAWSAEREGKDWYDGVFQCWLLNKANDADYTSMGYGEGPRWGWQISSSYPSIEWEAYKSFNGSVRDAVTYWFYCFEWHSSQIAEWVDFEARARWGQYALDLIKGKDPIPPEGTIPGGGGGGGGGNTPKPENAPIYLIAIMAAKKRRMRKNGKSARTIRY